MEGLNDDLPPTIDPELVPQPGSLNNQEGQVELVADQKLESDKTNGLPAEIIQDLPNLNIAFKTVTDQGEKLINLEEVENQILNDEGMSRSSAEAIERMVGNFYEEVGEPNRFTTAPSGVGMESVNNFIQKVRLETKNAMVLDFKSFIESPLARAIEHLALVKEKYEPYCRETCAEMRANLQSYERPFYESDNVIFFMNVKKGDAVEGEFVNIFTTDIDLLVQTLTNGDNVDLVPYLATLRAVKSILDNTKIKGFVKCYNDTRDFTKAISPTAAVAYRDQPFSLKDLVTFYGSEDCCDAVANFVKIVEERMERFEAIRAESVVHMEKGTMDEFITFRTPEIHDFLRVVSHFFLYTNDYLLLLNQVKRLFEISQMTIEPTQTAE